uniref:Tubulin/FtsZ GTPase domain-containing protein n=1 Tax=Anser brachyrhynchus TaxID=132585 RepID=A0A8B9IB51_9AVES
VRECVSVNSSQAGIQMGNPKHEYRLRDGVISSKASSGQTDSSFGSFFNETDSGKRVPRAILVGLEPTTIDEAWTGTYCTLLYLEQPISGKRDAANSCVQGYYTTGKEIVTQLLIGLVKWLTSAVSSKSFLVFHSFGGGMGLGFTSCLMEWLSVENGKKSKLEFSVYPALQVSTAHPTYTNLSRLIKQIVSYVTASLRFEVP